MKQHQDTSYENRQAIANKDGRQQHKLGKNTALQRLDLLLDEGSFEQIDELVQSPFLPDAQATDGVVTGFGTISGTRVAIYSQDFTILGGSLGRMHAQKICKIMDMAAKVGCPIIGLVDSGGARIQEGIHALAGYGEIFMRNSRYSGVIPQITAILGPCAGGAVYSPALTDVIIMTETISQMFITGPHVIEQVLHQTVTKEELGGSGVHGNKSGVAHLVAKTEQHCFEMIQKLLTYLPENYLSCPNADPSTCDFGQADIQSLIPDDENKVYDVKNVIEAIVDSGSFFELQPTFARNVVVGFAHMNGTSVGIVANQPLCKAGTLDIDASCKAARFIRLCDNFGIPIISLVDVPGFLPGVDQEHNGIIRHGAKLLYAYAQATVPKITMIMRKAFGGSYIVMGSKHLGADLVYAWPKAQIAVMGAQGAIKITARKELAVCVTDNERQRLFDEKVSEYKQQYLNPTTAAQWGYIDALIKPNATRKHLIRALEITSNKVEKLPTRKMGNIPL